jgi:hypothetical protein
MTLADLTALAGRHECLPGSAAVPLPDFFRPGQLYSDGNGYRAPELTNEFWVVAVSRHRERGGLRAFGWVRTGAPGALWHGHFLDEDAFEDWTETGPAPEADA